MRGSQIFRHPIGRSVEQRQIVVSANFDPTLPPPAGVTLLIGGTHGNEQATVRLLEDFLARGLPETPVAVLALHNPDALVRSSRHNARGVDLNRNCEFNWRADSEEPPGPEPWSEPETRALRDFILAVRPVKIVSLHWALAEIDADGHQSTALAQAMWEAMSADERRPYRLRVTEPGRGQRRLERIYAQCPGSFGQWCGYGLEYADGSAPAMITLELPYDPVAEARPDELSDDHVEFVRELWHRDADGYLHAVAPGVMKMLDAACAA
jgi:hypothetical protein